MASHSVGNSHNITILISQIHPCTENVISDEMVSHEYHILILMSHTANVTGCCYINCYHYTLSDYNL